MDELAASWPQYVLIAAPSTVVISFFGWLGYRARPNRRRTLAGDPADDAPPPVTSTRRRRPKDTIEGE